MYFQLRYSDKHHVHDDNYLHNALYNNQISAGTQILHLLLKIQSLNLQMPVQKSV